MQFLAFEIGQIPFRILLEDIKQEFTLSDSQLGLVSGFAFVAIYITMGIPAAYLADRKNRSKLISIALALWSLMTVLCGAAQNYTQATTTNKSKHRSDKTKNQTHPVKTHHPKANSNVMKPKPNSSKQYSTNTNKHRNDETKIKRIQAKHNKQKQTWE